MGDREEQVKKPCGPGPWSPEGTKGKLVWLESQSERKSGMTKGLREAGAGL